MYKFTAEHLYQKLRKILNVYYNLRLKKVKSRQKIIYSIIRDDFLQHFLL